MGAVFVIVRLGAVPFPPSPLFFAGDCGLSVRQMSCWMRSVWVGKHPARCGIMSGDHHRCFMNTGDWAFRQVFFNANALPCINIGADMWGESGIAAGVYTRWCLSTLHIAP